MHNVRGPAEREGDMLAQVAATGAAETRLLALCAAHGTATVEAAMAALHDRSEAAMRAAIGSLPQGEFLGEDFLDDDGPGGAAGGGAGADHGAAGQRDLRLLRHG